MPHVHEKIDLTVSAYIVHPDLNKVLLVWHKKFDGWLQVGGHVELDEDTDTALEREIMEETGLEVEVISPFVGKKDPNENDKVLRSPEWVNIHETYTKGHFHLDLRYVAIAKTTDLNPGPGESTKFHWFTRSDLYNSQYGIRPGDRWYQLEALKIAKAARQK